MKLSVSFIVPFYNEEKSLNQVYINIKKIIKFFKIIDHEIILVNDCSKDNSEKFALKLKKKDFRTSYIKHNKNLGLGAALKTGILKTKKKHIIWVPGDNEHDFNGLKPLFTELKKNESLDIIIPYVIKTKKRSLLRRLISKTYTNFINLIFLKKMPYYNGCFIYKKKIINQSIKAMNNPSMTFMSELLIRSLKLTNNYSIVGYNLNIRKNGPRKSSALKISNIIIGLYHIIKLRIII